MGALCAARNVNGGGGDETPTHRQEKNAPFFFATEINKVSCLSLVGGPAAKNTGQPNKQLFWRRLADFPALLSIVSGQTYTTPAGARRPPTDTHIQTAYIHFSTYIYNPTPYTTRQHEKKTLLRRAHQLFL